ncbi:MAG: DapH/DapD/GlmU-related protein [Nitrospirota bacterium]
MNIKLIRGMLKGLFLKKAGFPIYIENNVLFRGRSFISIGKGSFISKDVSIKTRGGNVVIGENVLIRDGVRLQGGSEPAPCCIIGEYSSINHNSSILFSGGVFIGKYVMIGPNVVITSGGHRFDDISIPMRFQECYFERIVIEDDVWIGALSVILPGIQIGKGAVVGAGSVVTRDVEPFSIVAGNPARVLNDRMETIKNE